MNNLCSGSGCTAYIRLSTCRRKKNVVKEKETFELTWFKHLFFPQKQPLTLIICFVILESLYWALVSKKPKVISWSLRVQVWMGPVLHCAAKHENDLQKIDQLWKLCYLGWISVLGQRRKVNKFFPFKVKLTTPLQKWPVCCTTEDKKNTPKQNATIILAQWW